MRLVSKITSIPERLKAFLDPILSKALTPLIHDKERLTGTQLRLLEMYLEPGDILLVNSGWLMDKVIPGKWTHCGVFIGEMKKNEFLGLPIPTHDIPTLTDKLVIHATVPRVTVDDCVEFGRGTFEVKVLRLPADVKRDIMLTRLLQRMKIALKTGGSYDWGFSFATRGRWYCSELIYWGLGGEGGDPTLDFATQMNVTPSTSRIWGRAIPPQNFDPFAMQEQGKPTTLFYEVLHLKNTRKETFTIVEGKRR